MRHKGYNSFSYPPDLVEEKGCEVCGCICDVNRGVVGPTSFAGAMAKCKTPHDSFTCPYSDEEWHISALSMSLERDEFHSPSLKKLIQSDIDDIVFNNVNPFIEAERS
jgi:hypothetical protein